MQLPRQPALSEARRELLAPRGPLPVAEGRLAPLDELEQLLPQRRQLDRAVLALDERRQVPPGLEERPVGLLDAARAQVEVPQPRQDLGVRRGLRLPLRGGDLVVEPGAAQVGAYWSAPGVAVVVAPDVKAVRQFSEVSLWPP